MHINKPVHVRICVNKFQVLNKIYDGKQSQLEECVI